MIWPRRRRDGTIGYQVRYRGVKTETFDNRDDATDYEYEEKRRLRLGTMYVAAAKTFGAELDRYLVRHAKHENLRDSTVRRHNETARKLKPLRGVPVPALHVTQVEDWLHEVEAPNQAAKALGLLKAVLRSAEGRGQAVDRAIFKLTPPVYDERESRFLSYEQMKQLSSWMLGFVNRIVLVAGLTGMRQGELLSLTTSDLCLDGCDENREPHVHVRQGKTKAARRRVALVGPVVTLLREQLLARPPSQYVFPTKTGLRWDRNRFMERAFRKAVKRGGDEYAGVTFHSLRHSFVSIAAKAGWSYEHIAEQVGWSSRTAAFMYQRYRHLFEDEMPTQVAKLDAFLSASDNAGSSHG
jgi:integrase